MNINQVFELMKHESNRLNLPVIHKSDLDTDKNDLKRYLDAGITQFLWVIREGGTLLFPVGYGINPLHAEFWHNEGYPVTPYIVSMEVGSLTPITTKKMIEIANKTPVGDVMEVIKRGCELNFWGVWHSPKFEDFPQTEWREYFQQTGNKLMVKMISDKL
ncbi:hypothetical protein [Shewanella sp. SM87]|jgi:hypothetical protein|uniref:hypothetical protein n=1 Tax=Shewanella TaxID=22 RepID=UPI0021D8142E|nr:hypothetical protein [Shewanella sp. SM87]MCU8010216.1 hypothetical protein [Shewanella sp. SM87]